jgi:hypothetical protein
VANQLGNQAAADINNAMIEKYLPMAYNQYQGRISNLQGLYNTAYQQDVTRPISISQQTGTYQDPEMMRLYNTVLQAKQNYANAKTPEEKAAAHQAAEAARQMIRNMHGNADIVGADVTYDKAAGNQGQFGIRTLAGQAEDRAKQQANLGAAIDVSNLTGNVVHPQDDWSGLYRQAAAGGQGQTFEASDANRNFDYKVGRDKAIDAQWKAEFDHRVEQDGIQNALAWANDARAQKEFEDNSAYKWAGLDADLAAAVNKDASYEGMTANQVVDNVRKNLAGEDGKIPAGQESAAYLQIINAGLPEDQEEQALAAIGLTKSQIETLDKQYLTDAGKQ